MNAPEQLALLEPTGDEVVSLIGRQVHIAKAYEAAAERCAARGYPHAEGWNRAYAAVAWRQADELEMLAQFERLGGVS